MVGILGLEERFLIHSSSFAALSSQRNSNKLSSSRVRKSDGRTKSNLINDSKPVRSFQRDMIRGKRNGGANNHVKNNAISATANAVSRRESQSQGGGPGSRRRAASNRFLQSQNISPGKSRGYSPKAVGGGKSPNGSMGGDGGYEGGSNSGKSPKAGSGYSARHQHQQVRRKLRREELSGSEGRSDELNNAVLRRFAPRFCYFHI